MKTNKEVIAILSTYPLDSLLYTSEVIEDKNGHYVDGIVIAEPTNYDEIGTIILGEEEEGDYV
jgi:hypothetical protein